MEKNQSISKQQLNPRPKNEIIAQSISYHYAANLVGVGSLRPVVAGGVLL
jgi:hypothetical protein